MLSAYPSQLFSPSDQNLVSQAYTKTSQSVLLCAQNIDNIQGRVLLQTSPFHAYDTEKVVAHARSYAREFEKVGISKDRLCIKIPCTGPAMNAGPILLKDGIRTLGTSLFGLPQAIAASQAGCLYISPYYNGPSQHDRRCFE
jgi:transaldolase